MIPPGLPKCGHGWSRRKALETAHYELRADPPFSAVVFRSLEAAKQAFEQHLPPEATA